MSTRVATTLSPQAWGALDRLREYRGIETMADALRVVVEEATAAFESQIVGAGQMAVLHPIVAGLASAHAVGQEFGAAVRARQEALIAADCLCLFSCADDPATACSLSGQWHVHPARYEGDVVGPCPVHPDAPGDR